MKFESEWKPPGKGKGNAGINVNDISRESVAANHSESPSISDGKNGSSLRQSDVLDLVQTISNIQLPEKKSGDEVDLFKKLLSNKDVVVEKKKFSGSLVTDDNEKWSIIRKLARCSKEEEFNEEEDEDEGEEAQEEEGETGDEPADAKYLTLKSMESLLKHSKKPNNSLVFCKECNLFMKRSSFGGHNRFVHKKIRKFLCQTCGYATHTGSILRQHIQAVHVGYIFECDKCSRKFNLAKRLRKHKETCHSKTPSAPEKSLLCHYCGFAFSRLSYLKIHLLTHTGETPLQCQYCDRRFKFRWAMIQHERLHTGVKPYKCEYCEERFTQNRVRKTHEYKVHGNLSSKPKEKVKTDGSEVVDKI